MTSTDEAATAALCADIELRIRQSADLVLPLDQTLALLRELQQFELGRFLLHNQGLNGYWTSYVFRHGPDRETASPLEEWMLNRSLMRQARERFHRFKKEIAGNIHEGATLASIPCGVMDDLLQQDYRGIDQVKLIGIDIDPESLRLAAANAAHRDLGQHCEFRARDAWNLDASSEADLIVSNGLNIYESDPERLTRLYRNLHQALRPGGRLLLSFLPPLPPPPGQDSDAAAGWAAYGMTEEDVLRELSLFRDIIRPNYLNFCTEAEMRDQLEDVGFTVEAVRYNHNGVLPIVVAARL
ncbi:class I SAM-dependent methyltransferase [Streptomyces sp. NPDC058612]|uniref:class I SAM-dependent methyltransferase n=1 Tax=Streptomyces sp. NPDC058612 TaxID=3346555 RepID=UPI003661FA6C